MQKKKKKKKKDGEGVGGGSSAIKMVEEQNSVCFPAYFQYTNISSLTFLFVTVELWPPNMGIPKCTELS